MRTKTRTNVQFPAPAKKKSFFEILLRMIVGFFIIVSIAKATLFVAFNIPSLAATRDGGKTIAYFVSSYF